MLNSSHQSLEEAFKESRPKNLPLSIYPFRVLGMGCGILPILVYAYQNDYSFLAFCWPIFVGILWPQLAFGLTKISRNGYQAEVRNLLADTFLAATLVTFVNFCVLPSVAICSVLLADKLNSGVQKIFAKACYVLFLGIAISWLFWSGPADLDASFEVMLATLPLFIVHTIAIARNNAILVSKVRKKNKLLNKITQTDMLTGVDSRAYWLFKAKEVSVSKKYKNTSLLIVDIDNFKSINDQWGHNIGDRILKDVAESLRFPDEQQGFVGRLGGDEFALLSFLSDSDLDAHIRNATNNIERLAGAYNNRIPNTLSIGLVKITNQDSDISHWMELADKALYKAKKKGRNQMVRAE